MSVSLCENMCNSCPFAITAESAQAYNWGCLPGSYDIIELKRQSGHNWSCHSDESVICRGFAESIDEDHPDLSWKTGGLISYDTWYRHGEEVAIERAEAEYVRIHDN